MDFKRFLNRQVKVVQKDGFIKWGICVIADDSWIVLKYIDGRHATIAVSEIKEIQEGVQR